MKKTLVCSAVLGSFAATATAQSSITLYGIIDMAISKANSGQSNLSYFSDWQVGRAGEWSVHPGTSSRLGLRGVEDLGGGLKALFLLDHRFMPNTGAIEPRDGVSFSGGTRAYTPGFWNAQSYVGLAGNFGEVRVGRNATPTFNLGLATDPWSMDYNVAGFGGFTRGGNPVGAARSSILYQSPNLVGFTATLLFGMYDGVPSATTVGVPNDRNIGASLTYASGPLWVGLAYNDSQRPDTILNRTTALGLTYNVDVLKAFANYSIGKNSIASNADTKTMLLGAHIPAGKGYVRTAVGRFDPALGFNPNAVTPGATAATTPNPYAAYPVTLGQNSTKFGIGYVYTLSRRSSLSADIGSNKTAGYTRSAGFQAGLKHAF